MKAKRKTSTIKTGKKTKTNIKTKTNQKKQTNKQTRQNKNKKKRKEKKQMIIALIGLAIKKKKITTNKNQNPKADLDF